jgi:hypothetical protein
MSHEAKNNPLLIPAIGAVIVAVMYMTAFHSKRDENKELKHKIEILETKLKIYEKED